MGKVEVNKQNKRTSLMNTSLDLFVKQGFAKTTISDIVKNAGLAKGTFYLYFKDKYDLRDQLVARKSAQILTEAQAALRFSPIDPNDPEEYILAIVDYILNYLSQNHRILKFISKNLSWGVFRNAVINSQDPDSKTFTEVYNSFLEALSSKNLHCSNPELLLYTIIELVSSSCYSCILYSTPVSIDTYKPYLHEAIHQIICGFVSKYPSAENEVSRSADADRPAVAEKKD